MEPAQKTVLPKLFRLKYQEGITSSVELSEWLSLPVDETITCERLLDEHLRQKLGVITSERLQYVCSSCLEARMVADPERNERVCQACGVVDNSPTTEDMDDSLSFDVAYAPASSAAVCKTTGGTLSVKEQQAVLRNGSFGQAGNEDIPLRAKQIRIMTRTEHPVLDGLLKKNLALMEKYGLENDHVFKNDMGRHLRRAFWVSRELELSLTKKGLLDTVFWVTLSQHNKPHVAERARRHLKIEPRLLYLILRTSSFVEQVKAEKDVAVHVVDVMFKNNPKSMHV